MKTALFALLGLLLQVASGEPVQAAEPAPAHPVLVFAAASLTDVLDEIAATFTSRTHVRIDSSYDSSSILARQIAAGAPAEVFVSADTDWMDYLAQRHLLRPGSRRDIVSNRLVLIAPADSSLRLSIAPGFALATALGVDGRLSVGDPDAVPAGRYAKAALETLGVWDGVKMRLVRAENVRAALAYVARAEAPLGIVYRTDALAERRVRIVGEFPADSHPPIRYPVALTTRAGPRAAQFEQFVAGPLAAAIFRRYGFSSIKAPGASGD